MHVPATPSSPGRAGRPISLRRVIVSSTIGSTVEWYDFFIFATASVLAFNHVFFPSVSPLVGTLIALTTYAVGFIARPLGGLFFGPMGDRKGRKTALVITLLISGISTFAVGLLPGYDVIGVWAPLALLVVRILHGFSIGGEQANAILIACEHAPAPRRGFYASFIQLGAPVGYLLPLGLFALLTANMSSEAFLAWGWRVPFLLAGILVALGLYIRLNLTDAPEFIEARARQKEVRTPLKDVLRQYPREVWYGIGAKLAEGVTFSAYSVLIVAYAVNQGIAKATLTEATLVALILESVLLPLYGMASDRFGRRPIYLLGAVLCLVGAPLVFYAASIKDIPLLWGAIIFALAFGHGPMYGAQASFFAELFPVERRATGLSFVQQIGSVLGAALALLSSWLLNIGNGAPWYLVGYLLLNVVITIVSVIRLRETAPRFAGTQPDAGPRPYTVTG
jgi:MFS family permease